MFAVSVVLALSITGPRPAAPPTGEAIVTSMHDRYAKTWYRQLSFVQRAIFADGRPEGEWWEAMRIPGRLRIDVAPVDSAPRTIVYRGDSSYVFTNGTLGQPTRQPNLLLALGFDVYGQPPAATIELIKKENFDLSRVHESTWQGRPVYVIGAVKGDTTSNQFWVDKDRLLFVRLIEKRPNGLSDIRFDKYVQLAGGWLATEVHFFSGGKESFTEIYRDWKVNPAVTEDLFDVSRWKRAAWIPKQ